MRTSERSIPLLALAALASLAAPGSGHAEQAQRGPVVELATGTVEAPTVALAADGQRALVVWSRLDGIHAALLHGADLASVGPELALHQHSGVHLTPDVAVDGKGRFAVVWQGGIGDEAGGDGSGSGIFLRRLDPAGVPVGDERRVNRERHLDQTAPRIAAEAGGRLAIAWEDRLESSHGAIPAHGFTAFAADGRRLFADQVESGSGFAEVRLGGVAAAPGFFTVGATDLPPLCDEGDGAGFGVTRQVAVARVGWKGKPIAAPALFQDADADGCSGPRLLDLLSSGYGPLAFFDGNANYNVARFDPVTGQRPEQRQIVADHESCTASGCPRVVAVGGDSRGRFVVIWETALPVDCGGIAYRLSAELYGRDGKLRSGRFAIADEASSQPQFPAAALSADGTLMVVWVETRDGEPTLLARRLEIR